MKYKEISIKAPEPLIDEFKKTCKKLYGRKKIECYQQLLIEFINNHTNYTPKIEKGPRVRQ